ncbi:MAG: hypothetical protein KJO72_07950 [Gammaproteobacteria bacterium]|nr:hypothetical protein [Gammaproteobacteria bacterium]
MNKALIQGGARLAFDCVEGVTRIVEDMHESIAESASPLAWASRGSEPAHGKIAESVYSIIRGVNGTLRAGADQAGKLLPGQRGDPIKSEKEARLTAALNGIFGDHLEDTGNALAIPMMLIASGEALSLNKESLSKCLPRVTSHPVVFIHGLSLSEHSWKRGGTRIGDCLEQELDVTSLYLRYNTGRHISTNGRELARLLEQLCANWPVPIEALTLVGHSMGGLVIRSACWFADQARANWLNPLKNVVCLGTPHHGSPLEKAGHAFDLALRRIPHVEPLAVGRVRSAGIKDLRFGNLLDEDWNGQNPDRFEPDSRRVVPLLEGVNYFFIAASVGQAEKDLSGRLLGDLLVRLGSATGEHPDELRALQIDPQNCRIFHEKNHFDLLSDGAVHRQVMKWIAGDR